MASELQCDHTTGRTVYFQIRNAVGQIWNGSTFEAYQTANIATYSVAATEQGTASRLYTGTMPAVAAGIYAIVAKDRAGGAPAESDTTVAVGDLDWDGAAVLPLSQIAADLPQRITKNTALAGFMFTMVDSADHVTGKTGLTITSTRSLDGAAFGACANSASEIGNGVYKINLAAGDLNADTVTLKFAAAGADTRLVHLVTQPT